MTGESPQAAYRRELRELRAAHRAQRTTGRPLGLMPGGDCPDCGDRRSTAETLRVHRWLAHGVEDLVA